MKQHFTGATIQSYSNYQNHQPRTLTDAAGKTTTITYTTHGQVETVTNALNEVTTYAYETNPVANGYGMVLSVTGPQIGASTVFTYDSADRIKTVTDSSSRTLAYDYDAFDRVTLITYPDAVTGNPGTPATTEQFVYKYLDLFATKDRENRWTRTWHNALRQPILTADALGRSTRYEWCRCGALQKLTDAKGQTTSWKYDEQGRNYEKTYPDNRTEKTSYQPLSGRVSTMTDAAGQVATFAYYMGGMVSSKTFSNLAAGTAATATVSYSYRPDFPLIYAVSDATGLTFFDYYPVGQQGAMQLKTVDGPITGTGDLITYAYDELGRKKTRNIGATGTENLITLGYDSLSRVTSAAMTSPAGNFGNFGYSYVGATGRLDYVNLPNGQKTSFDYFPASGDNRLKTINHLTSATAGSTISRFDYTYSPDGSIATWQRQFGSDPATALTLGYDLANQLTSANLAPVVTPASITQRYSYQYDPSGNRTSEQVGNLVTSASHNNANQITGTAGGGKLLVAGSTDEPAQVKVNGQPATTTAPPENLYQAWATVIPGTNTLTVEATDYATPPNTTAKSWSVSVTGSAARAFTYDGNGNTLSDGLRTFQWDAENRLVKITQGANVYEFTYDGLSRRVAEKLNGTLTKRWVWNGSQIAEQRDATGSTVQRQHYSQGEKRIGGTDAGNYYYTRDHLGSIREMTDSTAAVRARYDYDPYGARTKLSGNLDCDFGFTGHYYHAASNLHLTLYRAYDQDSGRWLSADPIGERGGLNLYGYVGNDPLNFTDPLGLDRWVSGGIGHTYIVANDKCSSTGFSQYEFGPAGGWLNLLHGPGEVFITEVDGPPPGWRSTKITSTVEQDQVLRETALALRANPSSYNLVGNNCRHFTSVMKDAGMSAPNNPLTFIPLLSFPYAQPSYQGGTSMDIYKHMPPGGYPQGF